MVREEKEDLEKLRVKLREAFKTRETIENLPKTRYIYICISRTTVSQDV